MALYTESAWAETYGKFKPELDRMAGWMAVHLASVGAPSRTANPEQYFADRFASLCWEFRFELSKIAHYLLDFEPEDEFDFEPMSRVLRFVCAPMIEDFESWANENCYELASTSVRTWKFVNKDVVVRRYAGDKDSFGWLVGCHDFTAVVYRPDNEPLKFTVSVAWG